MTRKLQRYVEPALDEKRLARQWAAIAGRPARRRVAFATAAPWALAAGLASVLAWRSAHPPTAAVSAPPPALGATYEALDASATVSLGEGTTITLEPHARLDVVDATQANVRVRLVRGGASFAVRHDPTRAFVVEAGSTSVVDVGTEFHVIYTETGAVAVEVRSGAVRLERPGAVSELRAGESWSSAPIASPGASAVASAPLAAADAEAPPPSPIAVDPDRAAFAAFEKRAADDPSGAFDELGDDRFARLVTRASAKDVWLLANTARLSAHPRAAATAYDALRRRFRADAHAGLAAFELGRLRRDKLDDAAGAEEAYADAIALAPEGSFREDAESRRIETLEVLGRTSECSEARASYLARYPSGVHATVVARRCGGK